ncbi:ribonuclease T [Paraburkholderia aspalathi]|nr:ribonuclease T [Paraburkholderia aspalathi]
MLLSIGLISAAGINQSLAQDRAGDFDFYVLSLSWSPSYCAAKGSNADRQQCGTNRPFSFIVHGLWPQNERGYPRDCPLGRDKSRGSYVARELVSSLHDIMPSTGLIVHEWRKHGSCSGLTQAEYFETLRNAYAQVKIPASLRNVAVSRKVDPLLVEKAFVVANPGMKSAGISVTCDRNYLQEVRICMTRDLRFRTCDQVDRASCRSRSVNLPATR